MTVFEQVTVNFQIKIFTNFVIKNLGLYPYPD
jgi:hypothetical protein